MSYRGRFAPSPTGPLHFGSLITAVGSYLDAKKAGGEWLVRIEDLDPPREIPGAADAILRTLERLGFEWDEPVLCQSARLDAYAEVLQRLVNLQRVYPCSCSRSELLEAAGDEPPQEELRYPGFCRNGPRNLQGPFAHRFRVPPEPVHFHDALQGTLSIDLHKNIGDFVVKRRDGLFAYQLAVVADDAEQAITHVVRGADLLFNTPRQIALQNTLKLPIPHYMHLPLATDAAGRKLSKSMQAPAIDSLSPSRALWKALEFLRQSPPRELFDTSPRELWNWAIEYWSTQGLQGLRTGKLGLD